MKYFSKKITVDGQTFDSKGEYQRWLVLKDMERQFALFAGSQGGITHLERQVVFPLYALKGRVDEDGKMVQSCESEFIGDFTADFVYRQDGQLVVEDFKSPITATEKAFRRTKRIFEVCYGIPLTISTSKGTTTAFTKQRKSKAKP